MDLFAAEHVAPFPDTGDLLFAAGLLSNHHNPQKLRPIRSLPPPPGYVVHAELPHKNLDTLEPSIHPLHPNGSGSGHSQLPRVHESSSSLDDEDDVENSSGSTKEFGSRKRRKKTARKIEDFVENLVKKVMEKQEQMHNELMEMIDKKEKERIQREEAWRREEMERIKKDEEARARERSRNLALISFLQKLSGHEIPIPQPAEESRKTEENETEVNNRKDFNSDPSNNRWPDVEVQALISVRTSLEHRFGLTGSSKGSIWEEISEALHGLGYNRSAKKCKEKWENINKYYKRTVGSGKKRPLNSKTCPYFDELDNLYRNGTLSIGNALSNTNSVSKNEEKEQCEI
uniref:Trihelix transcription factor GT-2 isoform X1 n=2 Tax=Cicer arietinum TaxID=3827 RepID=A0A1S2XAJ9_CICAR|nr:trihelix transcription factor GT-2 isoform X1 [Cicer arietinum]XP_004486348.1 trihelix transcription factor GT-2 isoform X2 [Cicer arietinum]